MMSSDIFETVTFLGLAASLGAEGTAAFWHPSHTH